MSPGNRLLPPPGGEFWPYPCFLGLPPEHSDPRRSKVMVLPLPYEATTCYGAGTRFGPEAIIQASKQIELYDHVTRCTAATELGFHTFPPLFPDFSSPNRMVEVITRCAASAHRPGKFVLGLGGEHSITPGLVRAAAHRHKNLCVVQVDAHADLQHDYEGTTHSHACAMRRAVEALGRSRGVQLIQVGIRNISGPGDRFRRGHRDRIRTFWADQVLADAAGAWLAEIAELISRRNVYLSVDLDGLDPSIMPATGTPEPGGLLWHHVAGLVEVLAAAARLVAADIVELAPQPGNHAPDFLAAKLGYLIARRAFGK